MSGTLTGGRKAARTIKARDPDFYRRIGAAGGAKRVPKGFGVNPELARIAGAKGGRISKRASNKSKQETSA